MFFEVLGISTFGDEIYFILYVLSLHSSSIYTYHTFISSFLFHDQSCRLGPDRCPHRGCADTKRLLLHIKTCSVAPGGGYGCAAKGCDSARKLLNHYKRCRDVRARQAAQQQKTNAKPHVCLVCSLMARHAKSFAESSSSSSSTCKQKKVATDAISKTERWRARIQQQQQQQQEAQKRSTEQQMSKSVSFSFDTSMKSASSMRQSKSFDEMKTFDQPDFNPPSAISTVIPKPATGLSRSTSSQMMPPPPPRPPRGGSGAGTNSTTTSSIPSEISNQLSTSAPAAPSPLLVSPSHRTSSPLPSTTFETPPPQHVLQQQRIETVAASVAAPPFATVKGSAALGKSYDSSRSYFPESMVVRHDQLERQEDKTSSPRRRSDSFHFSELSLQDDAAGTPMGTVIGSTYQGSLQDGRRQGKRRSASCDTLTALCATIREEESDTDGDSEGGVFEMADDA